MAAVDTRVRRLAFWVAAGMVAGLGCECDDNIGQLNSAIELPPEIDFGSGALGSTKTATITVRNGGSFQLTATFVTDVPFSVGTSSITVGTFQTVDLAVHFLPTALGEHTGAIRVTSDDPDQPELMVALRGVGIEAAVKVEPAMIDWGEVLVTPASRPEVRTITVSNPGTDELELLGIEIVDGDRSADCDGPFCIDRKNAVRTYPPGHSETFEASFEPADRGANNDAIVIHTTAPAARRITVPLSGTGVGPTMALCASARGGAEQCSHTGGTPKVDFGFVQRMSGEMGAIRALNIGDRDLTISSALKVGESGEFAFAPDLMAVPIVIAPNEETSWQVTYTPDDYEFDSFIVRFVTDSTSRDGQSLRIEGDVARPRIDVQPDSLTFRHSGNVPMGRTSVRIFNCGQRELEIMQDVSIRQTLGPEPAFSLDNAPQRGDTVQPQDCNTDPAGFEFYVVFETDTPGTYNAEIDIHSSDPRDEMVQVRIQATRS